ncbi:cytochrome c oxidase subunit II [Anaeromyxobacter diazotrophicus]|uniref:cytochrome-c oxidase n=1 Tax=Anaeromyxobacter diazotrophicus TaxID=2590199 RepID=A0A7I9VSY3_9BACT|nr:cytochrome c oxidase subunit II [Anaeromyxobacter diazotrophicus]GEJ59047.1 cytochrome c oxidase subunit 2 [Anaeromyxobacter diazotrophicus]
MNDLMRRILFLPEQGSAYATEVDHLHFFVITITMIGATGVALAAVLFYLRYRRRAAHQPTPHVEPKAIHEVLFIGVPLAFFLLWFAIGFPLFVRLQTPPKDAMDVYVQGKKWMWKFAYPGGPNGVDVLRVPAGRPVRLLITSRDVIHSFFVPDFRLKQDAVPGRYSQIWFTAKAPGSHQVLCAEYCGIGHSAMLAEIVAMPPAEFDAWLAEARRATQVAAQDSPDDRADPRTSLAEQGRRLAAEYGCFKCHTVDGTRHIGPTWLDLYRKNEKLQDGKTVIADEAYLTESMMDPAAKLVAGYQNVMPTFQGRVPGPEIAAIVEFIKSLRTDAVRPEPSKGPVYVPVPGYDPTISR